MTDQTPIERAAIAVYEAGPGYELTGGKPWEDISRSSQDNMVRNARAAFNSIDVDELAQTLANHRYEVAYGGCPCGADFEGEPTLEDERSAYDHHQALAVKDWLTGKDQR